MQICSEEPIHQNKKFWGTGFLIGQKAILTANHILADIEKEKGHDIFVKTSNYPNGIRIEKENIRCSKEKDIALLILNDNQKYEGKKFIQLDYKPSTKLGKSDFYISGYTSGNDSPELQVHHRYKRTCAKSLNYITDKTSSSGISGSPVIFNNRIIGIVRAAGATATYILPIFEIKELSEWVDLPFLGLTSTTTQDIPQYICAEINRDKQINTIKGKFREDDIKNVQIMFIAGAYDSKPYFLAKRLYEEIFQKKDYEQFYDKMKWEGSVCLNVFESFFGDEQIVDNIEQLIDSLKTDSNNKVLYYEIDIRDFYKNSFNEFMSFWNNLSEKVLNVKLLIVVSICYQKSFCGHLRYHLCKKKLSKMKDIFFLPTLGDIQKTEAELWLRDNKTAKTFFDIGLLGSDLDGLFNKRDQISLEKINSHIQSNKGTYKKNDFH